MATLGDPSLGYSYAYQLEHKDESRQRQVIAAHATLLTLSTIAVSLRILSRRLSKQPLKWDDFLIVACELLTYGLSTVNLLCASPRPSRNAAPRPLPPLPADPPAVRAGLGRHLFATNDLDGRAKFMQQYVFAILYSLIITGTKLSVLALLPPPVPRGQLPPAGVGGGGALPGHWHLGHPGRRLQLHAHPCLLGRGCQVPAASTFMHWPLPRRA